MKLDTLYVEKPWGRMDIPAMFPHADGRTIGEVWFDGPQDRRLDLLVKYIFTSDKLSIQVHPNDAQARARGLPRGKEECWYILDAVPGAVLGIGLKEAVDAETLHAAALDGSIEAMMDWKPVKPGDFFYIPAGTVHAIGAGVSLVEVQQNVDVTYRLYDYGRPRELHLDDGITVSRPAPYPDGLASHVAQGNRLMVDGPLFRLWHVSDAAFIADADVKGPLWIAPLNGVVTCGGETASAGECLLVDDLTGFALSDGGTALVSLSLA